MTRLNSNKKASVAAIGIAILAIAGFLVMSLFLYKMYQETRENMEVQGCKASISAHSFVVSGTKSQVFTDIKCPTREIMIKDLKKSQKTIAEDMHRCWYEWNKGDEEYFEGDGIFCHICSIYTFGDKGQKIDGMTRYLATNPIEVKYPGDVQGMKYVDYFQGFENVKDTPELTNEIQSVLKEDYIDTSHDYAAVFVYASKKEFIDKALEGGVRSNVGVGTALFGVAGGALGKLGAGLALTSGLTTISSSGVAVVAGTFLGLSPVGWAVIGTGVAVTAIATVGYILFGGTDYNWVSYIAFRPYNPEELESLGCQKLEVNQLSGRR